jgi:cysteine desulfurase
MEAYLDHAAATPLDPRVRAAVLPFLGEEFGSPASLHARGRRPAAALARARAQVAWLIGADPEAIVFTSGPTEARNLAVKGLLAANRGRGRHAVASAVEHPAVLAACRSAAEGGGALTVIGVDREGRIDRGALARAVRPDTALVALVHGQAEIGTLQDAAALIAAARSSRPDVPVHLDAAETAGVLPVSVDALGCDALTLGGPAMGAPPWAGALYLRPGAALQPQIEGGLQEWGSRAGAESLPGIVALGEAARLAAAEMEGRAARMRGLRDRLIAGLLAVPDVRLNGPREDRLPGHVQVSAGWVEGETLTLALAARGVAVSPGSACASARKAAPTLEAIGLEPPWTHSAILLTLSHTTREDEVDRAVAAFAEAVADLRAMSPLVG